METCFGETFYGNTVLDWVASFLDDIILDMVLDDLTRARLDSAVPTQTRHTKELA